MVDASVTDGRSFLLSHLINITAFKILQTVCVSEQEPAAVRLQAAAQWKCKPPGRGKGEENKHLTASTRTCSGVWESCFVTVTGGTSPTIVLHLSCVGRVSSFHHTFLCLAMLL